MARELIEIRIDITETDNFSVGWQHSVFGVIQNWHWEKPFAVPAPLGPDQNDYQISVSLKPNGQHWDLALRPSNRY